MLWEKGFRVVIFGGPFKWTTLNFRVLTLELILKVPKRTILINYQLNAGRIYFNTTRTLISSWVVMDYQFQRAAEAWPWSAIIIVHLKFISLELS